MPPYYVTLFLVLFALFYTGTRTEREGVFWLCIAGILATGYYLLLLILRSLGYV